MKKLKTLAKISTFAIALSMISVPTSTLAGSLSEEYDGQFVRDWSLTVFGDNDDAILEYGFNTWAWNEDTAHAYHNTKSHYAKIKNGNGVHASTSKVGGKWSNCEVKHAGSKVTYYCIW